MSDFPKSNLASILTCLKLVLKLQVNLIYRASLSQDLVIWLTFKTSLRRMKYRSSLNLRYPTRFVDSELCPLIIKKKWCLERQDKFLSYLYKTNLNLHITYQHLSWPWTIQNLSALYDLYCLSIYCLASDLWNIK
jgi:hypothetical protein